MKKILDYEEMLDELKLLDKSIIKEEIPIGYSAYNLPIPHYTYGNGKKHIVVTAGTHSVELITNVFVINLMKKISNKEIDIDKDKYTIHFLPIINPEGTLICTSGIRKLIPREMNSVQEQLMCLNYYLNARVDDLQNEYTNKDNKKVLYDLIRYSSPDDISDKYLDIKNSVKSIIDKYSLPDGIISMWTSNANGIDLNSNLECGQYIEKFKKGEDNYSSNRYFGINYFSPGPIGCPSKTSEYKIEPENEAFLKFINELKNNCDLIGCLVYHSCGGSVHYLDFMEEKNYWVDNHGLREIIYNRNVAKTYANEAKYTLYKPKTYTTFCSKIRSLIPGSLVVELSKLRCNPLSQFIDIDIKEYANNENVKLEGEISNMSNSFTNTINNNINAFTKTIDKMSEEYDFYKYNILVNPSNACPDNLNFNIIDVNSRYAENRMAEEETFKAFKKLQKFALENGYDIDIESGYRSKEHQERVWNDVLSRKGLEHTKKYVAVPGYSEHQTGLALDICLKVDDKFIIDTNLPEEFNEFLRENSYKFGFIIRYIPGKEDITGYNSEPWHLRFINSVEIAKFIKDNNICLEEWFELNKEFDINEENNKIKTRL